MLTLHRTDAPSALTQCETHPYPWGGSLLSCQTMAGLELRKLRRPGWRVSEWRCEAT